LSKTYTYDSFGKLLGSSGAVSNPFGFTGRESDPETGLMYYRARYYDVSIGRFISEDPIQFRGGNNFYVYVNNDPTAFVDPTGLKRKSTQYCSNLLDKIRNIQARIDKRTGELDEDPQGLPEACAGDKLRPSLSRAGHRMLINLDKALLAARKAEYLAFCDDDPPGLPIAVPPPTPKDSYFDRRF
jgi:RHS repeat-associated protein